MKIKNFFSKCNRIRSFFVDLVAFTKEMLNEKLGFLCNSDFNQTFWIRNSFNWSFAGK